MCSLAPTVRDTMLLTVACLLACDPTVQCPHARYEPQGRRVESAAECQFEPPLDECAFYCDPITCDGYDGETYCEDCGELEIFLNGECMDCRLGFAKGAVSADCTKWEERLPVLVSHV